MKMSALNSVVIIATLCASAPVKPDGDEFGLDYNLTVKHLAARMTQDGGDNPKATTTTNSDAASKGFQGEVMLICPDHVQAVERAGYQYEQYKAGSELPDMAVGIDFMLAEDKPYRLKNRTAIIPVHGLLLHRLSWHIPGFMTGYDYITSLIDMAEEDEDVDRIAFDFNTGGGMVAGCFETADVSMLSRNRPRRLQILSLYQPVTYLAL